jgi:tyrosine-protein phosphatase SIW14
MLLSKRLPYALLVLSLPLLAGNAPGIHNFDKVDDHVYRGGQPSSEGLKYLAKIGVKHIIDLRESGSRSRDEERVATAAGMHYVNVPMTGLTPPTEAETTKILAILEGADGPVFVHCMRGADRTGAVIAAYHINHDKWENGRALKDAKAHGMSFFQLPRESYIRNFHPRAVEASTEKPADAGVVTTNVRN